MSVTSALRKLTPAQRIAIKSAWQASWGDWYIPMSVRADVRRKLIENGLLGRAPGNPLLTLAHQVKAALLN